MLTELNPAVYANSLTEYKRRLSREVMIGDLPMGGLNPIRIQSMTTVDTMDTAGSIAQCLRMAEAGSEYIRITAPSMKEAANLENIRKGLRAAGCNAPLIADIHFTPNAAELAARLVEKVRINPGNYADRKRFEVIDYTETGYQAELDRIRDRFVPLVKICKEYGTAMRIGTNHGSLSDRILSRYGDTPLGMVESALEFLRICEDMNYYDIVISMKASNTQVMVQAYRMLIQKLEAEGLQPYPLHLGVTEAGDGEDGRIKSAVGIGTLLEDGLGDTIRVSLTEEPEYEVPVAKALADRYNHRTGHTPVAPVLHYPIDPFQHHRRVTHEMQNIGGKQVPRVIADISRLPLESYADLKALGHHYLPEPDKWHMADTGADYLYTGSNPAPFMLAAGSRQVQDFAAWQANRENSGVNKAAYTHPLLTIAELAAKPDLHPDLNFLKLSDTDALNPETTTLIKQFPNLVLLMGTENTHAMPALRRAFMELMNLGIENPVIIHLQYPAIDEDSLRLSAATDAGGLLIDGLGDGIMIGTALLPQTDKAALSETQKVYNSAAFGILQAARTRMSKTEYISCPSCGRTLFDLQETTALIRSRTDHLKGIKIGIMGCIVNGPGEMADADYGYVGVGKGKIALYRGQNVVKKSVPQVNAVDELIDIIREDGNWIEAGQQPV
ncbi:MAG: (E)-4-hydroxy-3-methylbut-2-enyl-diphosphate synthase [Bacteroidota bacterium]